MSHVLYLVRHAIAEDISASGRDADRRLTAIGASKMRKVAAGLRALGATPDALWTSPLQRARQTAAILGDELAVATQPNVRPELSPGHAPEGVIAKLTLVSQVRSVMLVGHEPNISELASLLLTGSPDGALLPFKKGAVAAIELGSLPPRAQGKLLWFLTPKQLRSLSGNPA